MSVVIFCYTRSTLPDKSTAEDVVPDLQKITSVSLAYSFAKRFMLVIEPDILDKDFEPYFTTFTVFLKAYDGQFERAIVEQDGLPFGDEHILYSDDYMHREWSAKIFKNEAADLGARSFIMKPINKSKLAAT